MTISEIPKIIVSVPVYHAVEPMPFIGFCILNQEMGKASLQGRYRAKMNVVGPKVKIPLVRNKACELALQEEATHLLFIDDDMFVHGAMIDDLLAMDAPIACPIFFKDNGDPLAFDIGEDGLPVPIANYPVDSIFEAPGGCGTGTMLIKIEVIKSVNPPWFFYPKDQRLGMDLEFCRRAKEKGFMTFCNSKILALQMGRASLFGQDSWDKRRISNEGKK